MTKISFFGLFSTVFFCLMSLSTARAQEIVFEDRFEGNLKPGWIWLRDNPIARRFANNALEIQVEPYAENEARNVLVRPTDFLGKGTFRIETQLTCIDQPCTQYQQGGIYWLQNGRVVFKVVQELVDGKLYIFPGKIPVNAETVNLRIICNGDNVCAEYSQNNESSYRRIYEGKLDVSSSDQVGLQCWHGPKGEKKPWIRFHYFRIIRDAD